jgi:nucleoside-diphosphate-sugar epimerase
LKVAVTGAAGFIGSHLCDHLLAVGHEVVGIDCFTDYYERELKEANLTVARADPGFAFVEADLCTDPIEPLLMDVEAVVHEAAAPGLVRSWDDVDQYLAGNVTAVQRLASACHTVGIGHLVHASTSSVYGLEATGPEGAPTVPVSPYGVSKLAAETLLQAYRITHGLPVTILRYFSVYGPRQRPDMAYRIFCEKLLSDQPLVVCGDGDQSRSNTYIADAVGATVAALHRRPDGSVFNIGGGVEIKLLDAVALLAQALGTVPSIEYAPPRPGDQRRTVAQIDRARTELGWKPVVHPEEGLARQARWALEGFDEGSSARAPRTGIDPTSSTA